MSLLSTLIVKTLPLIPKSLVGYFARPYIAGETLDDGIRVVKELNAKGIMATMDVLGESVSTREESLDMRGRAEEVLHAIKRHGLDSNLSIKPTQLGLSIDEAFCEENIRHLVRVAQGYGNFVRIDMEDHPWTDVTLRMYRKLRVEFPGHVGVVVQAYMRRCMDDINALMDEAPTNVRLCKGIYIEPVEIAFRDREEVRANYRALNERLLSNGAYVGIATHDDPLITHGIDLVKRLGLPREKYEFQMLLGVRARRRDELVAQGHRMRVYVPFGDQWYPYSTRRLKENPQVALHIAKAVFGIGQ